MTTLKRWAFWALLLLFSRATAVAQAGTLDPSFGEGGIYRLPRQTGVARYVDDILSWRQNDGKIVVMAISSSDYSSQVTQRRLNTDGLPDTAFADGVVALSPFSLYAALQRPDGSYGVIYLQSVPGGLDRTMLKWFEPDGTPAADSPVEIPIYFWSGRSIVYGTDGLLYVHGMDELHNKFGIFRLFEDGSPDQSWGNGGFVPIPDEVNWGEQGNLYLDGDNRLVFATESYEKDTVAMVRFWGNHGALDTSFSDDGIALVKGGWTPGQSWGRLLTQPDGKNIFSKLDMAAPTPQVTLFRLNEAGSIDLTFGQNGWVHTPIPTISSATAYYDNAIQAVRTTSGGLQFWIPLVDEVDQETDMLGLACFNDGSLNINFGDAGLKIIDLEQYDQPEVLLPGADDGVFIIATSTKSGTPPLMNTPSGYASVTDIFEDGMLNAGYGVDGVAKIFFPKASETYLSGFLQLPDGCIMMTGNYDDGLQQSYEITRRMADGTTDVTYGENGYVRQEVFDDNAPNVDVCIWEDGSVAFLSRMTNYTTRLLKFNAAGAPDEVFAPGGQLILDERFDRIESATAGRLVLYSRSEGMVTLKRLLFDGTPDLNFGVGGTTQVATSSVFNLTDIKITENGSIALLGYEGDVFNRVTVVYRRTATGQPDASFGVNGKLTENFSGYERPEVMLVLPDGGSLIAGNIDFQPIGYRDSLFLARLLPDGSRDISFGHLGVIVTSPLEINIPVALLVQPDGKIVLEQISSEVGGLAPRVILQTFLSDGSPDLAFGGDEGVSLPLVAYQEWPRMFWTPDDKILISGFEFPAPDLQPVLARVIPDYLSDTKMPVADTWDFAVFPNPCPSNQPFLQLKMQLDAPCHAAVDLIAADGKLVKSWPLRYYDQGEQLVQLPLGQSLPAGTYQCVWRAEGRVCSVILEIQ